MSEEQTLRYEVILAVASTRGIIQGIKRGFYSSISLQIKHTCLNREVQEMGYQIGLIFEHGAWARVYEIPSYLYEIYLSAVVECQLEEFIYDLLEFCDH